VSSASPALFRSLSWPLCAFPTIPNLFLDGPVGRLEAHPLESNAVGLPPRSRLWSPPHPLYGGNPPQQVVYQAPSLDALGLPVLRFNFRGAGLSAGFTRQRQGEQATSKPHQFSAAEFRTSPASRRFSASEAGLEPSRRLCRSSCHRSDCPRPSVNNTDFPISGAATNPSSLSMAPDDVAWAQPIGRTRRRVAR